jgi:branched-chain amino acid aminotransferase
LITPPISSSALEGITRDTIITLAHDMGYKTIIRKIPKSELYLADEVFLTGTAAEITPIIQIDHKKIGKVGKITKSMITAYNDVVMNKNDKYSNWLTAVY